MRDYDHIAARTVSPSSPATAVNPMTVNPPSSSPYPSPVDYSWFNNEPPVRIRRGGGETET